MTLGVGKRRSLGGVLALALIMGGLPTPAWANIGVPMIVVIMPIMGVSLVPIIAVEAWVYRRGLAVSLKRAAWVATWSNAVSTLIGIPITWGLLLLGQVFTGGGRSFGVESVTGKVLAVTWQSPWLVPHEEALHWMIPVAGLVMMVPFFFASWWSEYGVARWLFRDLPRPLVWRQVRNANMVSYALLTLWPLGMLLF